MGLKLSIDEDILRVAKSINQTYNGIEIKNALSQLKSKQV